MSEAHEKTRIRQLEDAAAHWEHKYANARQYNRNLEGRIRELEDVLRETLAMHDECICRNRRAAFSKALAPQSETAPNGKRRHEQECPGCVSPMRCNSNGCEMAGGPVFPVTSQETEGK
jgi:hypothetical protein